MVTGMFSLLRGSVCVLPMLILACLCDAAIAAGGNAEFRMPDPTPDTSLRGQGTVNRGQTIQNRQLPTPDLAANWSAEFRLRDTMRLWDFPEQLISYPVRFPPQTVRKTGLKLVAGLDDSAPSGVFQLSNVVEHAGFLDRAT